MAPTLMLQSRITYSKYLNGIAPTATRQREYARALQTWADSSPLNFHFVSDSGDPAGISGFSQGDIRIGDYVGASGIAHSYYPSSYGTTCGDQFLSTGYTCGIYGISSGSYIDL